MRVAEKRGGPDVAVWFAERRSDVEFPHAYSYSANGVCFIGATFHGVDRV